MFTKEEGMSSYTVVITTHTTAAAHTAATAHAATTAHATAHPAAPTLLA